MKDMSMNSTSIPIPNLASNICLCFVQLQYGVDESYKLNVPAQGNPIYANIEVSATKFSSSS